ncbi:MAG TPA: response regulator [Pyrinomonadaceae bacterium]|jgi:CheY-like chemotaxis protein|nr:response regulator [Pyrinomonadaceae bacterium]
MTKTILVVEDYDDARYLIRVMLQMLGHRVIEAIDGREAIECVQRERPDLILMDLALPIMDGVTATRHIRAMEGVSDVPVVCVTAHSEKYRDEALKAGANQVVRKPVDMDDLRPILAHYL